MIGDNLVMIGLVPITRYKCISIYTGNVCGQQAIGENALLTYDELIEAYNGGELDNLIVVPVTGYTQLIEDEEEGVYIP